MEPFARARTGKARVSTSTPIGPYVLDFFCAKASLAVEIDGMGHDMGDRPRRDLRRDFWLAEQGITVFHIAAAELRDVDEVADAIVRLAIDRL
jgi:very-short-patch-repair endonuclease